MTLLAAVITFAAVTGAVIVFPSDSLTKTYAAAIGGLTAAILPGVAMCLRKENLSKSLWRPETKIRGKILRPIAPVLAAIGTLLAVGPTMAEDTGSYRGGNFLLWPVAASPPIEAMRAVSPPTCINYMLAAMQDQEDEDQEDSENGFKCTGEEVSVDFREHVGGNITVEACVTNGKCTGSWDNLEIDVKITGSVCFTIQMERT